MQVRVINIIKISVRKVAYFSPAATLLVDRSQVQEKYNTYDLSDITFIGVLGIIHDRDDRHQRGREEE